MKESPSFQHRDLRRAFGQFATGVAVATARDASGSAIGVTINSFNSVSMDPPLVSFALGRGAHCLNAFLDCQTPAISILSREHQWLASNFARPSSCHWDGVPIRQSATGHIFVEGALAAFECNRETEWVAGDHLLFLLTVRSVRIEEDMPDPLLFFRGAFGSLTADRPTCKEFDSRWHESCDAALGWG